MKETKERTLYECSHARVKGDYIYCFKGYSLFLRSGNGHLDIGRLAEGQPLALSICQSCPDFDSMGMPVPPEERGWLNKKGLKQSHENTPQNWGRKGGESDVLMLRVEH